MSKAPAYETLTLRKEGAVDWLTLNRPERLNALDGTMIDELDDYFSRLRADSETRIVVMKGAGRAFCAGIDIKSVKTVVGNGIPADMRGQRRVSEVILRMRRCPQPILGLVHGPATGGGLGLLLATDIRIAGESLRLNCAFIRLGLTSCDVGVSYLLPRMVGASVAAELMLTGRFMDARRALSVGLVSEIVADDKLDEAAESYVADLLRTSPLGLKLTKEGFNMGLDAPSLESAIAMEDRNQVLTIQSDNFSEALTAFLEKRDPVFRDV